MLTLDPDICRQARLSRDPRFDGEFFLAVSTTGIYCRPICPARPPQESNVKYFRTAAEAAGQGYRPCLRCRPESAPFSPAWMGTSTTVRRALALIHEGYLNHHPLSALADRLGVGERYLRKLFKRQLGTTPSGVAHTQRLHFARKLLRETALPITEVAFASGFGSVRRFNGAARDAFGCSPGELRRNRAQSPADDALTLELNYRPPYDWEGVLDFFRRHAIDGLEAVAGNRYRRNMLTDHGPAVVEVGAHPRRHCLRVDIRAENGAALMPLVSRLRRMFDLDAQPGDIARRLERDRALARHVERWPGIRSPVVAGLFECAVRAVAGQQISTQAARALCAKIVAHCDRRLQCRGDSVLLFPRPEQVAALPDEALPMPGLRRNTLRALARHFAELDEGAESGVIDGLAALHGIGPWTTEMVRMRGLGDPDAFPLTDLGLVKSDPRLRRLGGAAFRRRTETWKPWRSYAANLLWRHLSHE